MFDGSVELDYYLTPKLKRNKYCGRVDGKFTSENRKKKKENPSTENSGNRVTIRDNEGQTAVIIGDNGQIIQKTGQPKPPDVSPYEGNERLLVPIGRLIMKHLFGGNMKHSLWPFYLLMVAIGVPTGYFSLGRIYLDPTSLSRPWYNPYITIALAFACLGSVSLGFGIREISKETECPKCGQKFMYTRKRRRIVAQGTHAGSEVTNYKSDFSCDNCGYKEKNVLEVRERELPTNED